MRVLFVCVHNASRSQMAEAFVNHLATQHGVDVRAESAGTVGGRPINPFAVEAMREIGISMDRHEPKLLTDVMVAHADRIITMGCGVDADACPTKFMVTEDWALEDPAGQSLDFVRTVRDDIHHRVRAMLGLA